MLVKLATRHGIGRSLRCHGTREVLPLQLKGQDKGTLPCAHDDPRAQGARRQTPPPSAIR